MKVVTKSKYDEKEKKEPLYVAKYFGLSSPVVYLCCEEFISAFSEAEFVKKKKGWRPRTKRYEACTNTLVEALD